MKVYDVAIIGAGAAGLSAAAAATRQNKSVLIMDVGDRPARKVLVSGGGKCNITNTAASADRYFGNNKNFVRGALSRVTPYDILQWCENHELNLYEKTSGRYFCSDGAAAVVDALLSDAHMASFVYKTNVLSMTKVNDVFCVGTTNGDYHAKSVIVATGGIALKNPLLMQQYSDILGMPIEVGVIKEGPAMGTAMFAAVAAIWSV